MSKQMKQDSNKRQLNQKTLKGLERSLKEEKNGTLKKYKNAKELIADEGIILEIGLV